jgi:hypothetical protein
MSRELLKLEKPALPRTTVMVVWMSARTRFAVPLRAQSGNRDDILNPLCRLFSGFGRQNWPLAEKITRHLQGTLSGSA